MASEDILARCIAKWHDGGVAFSPPVDEAEVRGLWNNLGRRASDDDVQLYTTVGGFAEYVDDCTVLLWFLWPWDMVRQENINFKRIDTCHVVTKLDARKRRPMEQEIINLFAARRGHFRYESGHHGELWLEIPRLYLRPARLRRFAEELVRRLAPHGVEAVCGPLVEGALLAQMVAEELDVEFYFAEQFARPRGDGLYPVDIGSLTPREP